MSILSTSLPYPICHRHLLDKGPGGPTHTRHPQPHNNINIFEPLTALVEAAARLLTAAQSITSPFGCISSSNRLLSSRQSFASTAFKNNNTLSPSRSRWSALGSQSYILSYSMYTRDTLKFFPFFSIQLIKACRVILDVSSSIYSARSAFSNSGQVGSAF
jgi:hypothetical protein